MFRAISVVRPAVALITALSCTHSYAVIYGFFDAADVTHLSGWACDSADFTTPIQVHLYASNIDSTACLYETGLPRICMIAVTTATGPREAAVGSFCGGYTNRGFDVPSPAVLADGYDHSVYAFAISLAGPSFQLLGSPIHARQALAQQRYLNSINDLPMPPLTQSPPADQLYHRFGSIPNWPTQVILWDVSQYTGFSISPSDRYLGQRGVSDTPGSLARQGLGDTIGVQLEPLSGGFVRPDPPAPAFPNTWLETDFSHPIRPWKYELSDRLQFSADFKFPDAYITPGDNIQLGLGAIFSYPGGANFFWYGVNLVSYVFTPEEGVHIDFAVPPPDRRPSVDSFIGPNTFYSRKLPGSDNSHSDTWNDNYHPFSVELDGFMIRNALERINRQLGFYIPADPSQYQVGAVGVSLEAFYASPNSTSHAGFSVKNFQVVHVSDGCHGCTCLNYRMCPPTRQVSFARECDVCPLPCDSCGGICCNPPNGPCLEPPETRCP